MPTFSITPRGPFSLARSADVIAHFLPVKIERLRALAGAALDGQLDAAALRALGERAAIAHLLALPGIGPFWASGIYLRACGEADSFPDEALSIAALGALHGLGDRPSETQVAQLTARYAPFRMWVCFLLRVAAARGLIDGIRHRESTIRRAGKRKR